MLVSQGYGHCGGGGNIAIEIALPQTFLVLYCFNIHKVYGFQLKNLSLVPEPSFSNVETNPGGRPPVPLLCSELWSQICVTRRICWFLDLVALSCCAGAGCLGPEVSLLTWEMDMEDFVNTNLSVVVRNAGFNGLLCETELSCVQFYINPNVGDWFNDS